MCQSRWPQCLCEVSYLWPQQLRHLQPRSNLWWTQPNLQELKHRRTKGGRSVSTVIEMMLTLPILKMRNADAKVWRDNIANSRCADVKKWLPSTRFLWLTCPQRWNISVSHTFLTTILPACLGKCHHNSNLKGWHSWGLRLQPLWVHQQGISIKVKNSIILPISADKLFFVNL